MSDALCQLPLPPSGRAGRGLSLRRLIARAAVLREILLDSVGNLGTRRSRTILSVIGIAIGTAAVIAMLEIGHTARQHAIRLYEAVGVDFVMVRPDAGQTGLPLSFAVAKGLASEGLGLDSVAPLAVGQVQAVSAGTEVPISLVAAGPELYALTGMAASSGRVVTDADGTSLHAVIGSAVAEAITRSTGRSPAAGDPVRVGSAVMTIVGRLADMPTNPLIGIQFDRAAVIPYSAARRVMPFRGVTQVIGRLSPGFDSGQMTERVRAYLRRHTRGGDASVMVSAELIDNVKKQMQVYQILLLAIGGVSLVVGGIGIMNVMLMSALERRAEIGLRRAVGARAGQIRLMFLAESVMLSSFGSLGGLIAGMAVGYVCAHLSGWQFVVAPSAIPLGIGMALVVGLFFGSYPAARAAAVSPIEALRALSD